MAVASIVIPAYNEAKVIRRCLSTILADAFPDEFEIVVVCNGCKDKTADIARTFREVKVVETPIGSKPLALNLGDQNATTFPRVYIDADVQISTSAVREVVSLLQTKGVLVAAPRAKVAYEDRPPWIRSFYKVWTKMPYFKTLIGSGVYGFSKEGRERFEKFPEIIADDEYARLCASPDERKTGEESFVIHPPRTIGGLLAIQTRARAGNKEISQKYPELMKNSGTSAERTLRTLLVSPSLWPHAPVYVGVVLASKMMADRKLRTHQEKLWERDETSRT